MSTLFRQKPSTNKRQKQKTTTMNRKFAIQNSVNENTNNQQKTIWTRGEP